MTRVDDERTSGNNVGEYLNIIRQLQESQNDGEEADLEFRVMDIELDSASASTANGTNVGNGMYVYG